MTDLYRCDLCCTYLNAGEVRQTEGEGTHLVHQRLLGVDCYPVVAVAFDPPVASSPAAAALAVPQTWRDQLTRLVIRTQAGDLLVDTMTLHVPHQGDYELIGGKYYRITHPPVVIRDDSGPVRVELVATL